ncbi:MAG TPA: glutathione S-transferase family protein [Myxococcota bacterium]|nr:glutathione S-transferase family protein [Myxococcota bacterium]
MLKIYHMPNSRSTRVIVAAEEIGVPYQIDLRRRSELKKPDLLAINPLGGAPVIEDGEVKMMESMAIVQYLIDRYDTQGRLAAPTTDPARAKYLQWLHFAEASLAPPVVAYLWSSGRWSTTPLDEKARQAARVRLDIAVGFVDDSLEGSPCMAGERFTAADIGIYWALHIARMLEAIDFGEMKNVSRYLARLDERPSIQKAMTIPPDYVREPPGSAQTPARVKRFP